MLWKKLLGSTIVRAWIAIVSFSALWLSARFLGAAGRGEISLLIANVSMLQLIIDIANGPAIIYLVPKISFRGILVAGLLWIFTLVGILWSFMSISNWHPDHWQETLILLLLFSLSNLVQLILQGQNKILEYNLSIFSQYLVLLVFLVWEFMFEGQATAEIYIQCLYYSYATGMLSALLLWYHWYSDPYPAQWKKAGEQMLREGWKAQLSNILNFFNGRLSYYLIVGFFLDQKYLGLYATAVAIGEAVWIISYSLSAVQYPALTRTNASDSVDLTIGLSKITMYASAGGMLVLSVVPSDFYQWIFGKEFTGLGQLILALSPGIIFIAVHKIYWNYFAAKGLFHINNWSNAAGLLVQIPTLSFALHVGGLWGAAAAYSLSGGITMMVLVYFFRKSCQLSWKKLFPGPQDWKQMKYVWHFRHSASQR
ncbi:MAG: polysaccharide biosynthesis C-terminal domain-containing protein [Cytophagaceae bacterium]|jgi:O-antigen/teichoic acid export membrane protein|nr:polysaccharide biosynthesis C-terminal domain-containing protein [Cytophagaceae bacterium]